jgi:hypothetical protein
MLHTKMSTAWVVAVLGAALLIAPPISAQQLARQIPSILFRTKCRSTPLMARQYPFSNSFHSAMVEYHAGLRSIFRSTIMFSNSARWLRLEELAGATGLEPAAAKI